MEYEVKREQKITTETCVRFEGENAAIYVRNNDSPAGDYITIIHHKPFYTVTLPVSAVAELGALLATLEVALRELPADLRAELHLKEGE